MQTQRYHWKVALTWRSGSYPTHFHHSLEAWMYAPCFDDPLYMLRARHAAYPQEAKLIYERFKKEIQKLRKEEVYDIYLDIERHDTVGFRYLGGERYKVVSEGVALCGKDEFEPYPLQDFLKVFKNKLEGIASQLQEACWELAAKKEAGANA